ncbi:MAG TPA: glutaredoxin 3 [Burkholderiales bacterium]|nr:glutaredoxin 3 [Burkholderiales bacterium]
MSTVRMYATGICPFCMMAERLLRAKGVIQITKIRVDLDPEKRIEMVQKTGRRTVPQIYINDRHVGGYEELAALEHSGKLGEMLCGGGNT